MSSKARILAIVPARGGSKRLPHKNLLPLGGKPLIAWTIEAAQASDCFVDVLVSTDDIEIAEVARAYGALVPWLRPAELATDTTVHRHQRRSPDQGRSLRDGRFARGLGGRRHYGVRPYEMQVPFGVVQEREERILGIEEKLRQVFTVSAGMYVLSPQVLDLVPSGQFFDMPSLFDVMMREGLHTHCHRIDGYWLDIGQLPDYERAKADFKKVFQ